MSNILKKQKEFVKKQNEKEHGYWSEKDLQYADQEYIILDHNALVDEIDTILALLCDKCRDECRARGIDPDNIVEGREQ